MCSFGNASTNRMTLDEHAIDGLIMCRMDVIVTIERNPFVHIHHLLSNRKRAHIIQLKVILHHIINPCLDFIAMLFVNGIAEAHHRLRLRITPLMREPEDVGIFSHNILNRQIYIIVCCTCYQPDLTFVIPYSLFYS